MIYSNCFDLFLSSTQQLLWRGKISFFFLSHPPWNVFRLNRINYKTTINCRKNKHAQILFRIDADFIYFLFFLNRPNTNQYRCNFSVATPVFIQFIWIQQNNFENVIFCEIFLVSPKLCPIFNTIFMQIQITKHLMIIISIRTLAVENVHQF